MFHSVVDKPLTITLIIPAYNEESHICACLDSVKIQTVMPDEVIVVDNNSTDDTVTIAREYPFVRVITEKQQGIVYARNAGFDAARGDIIARIDADTILKKGWVAFVKRFYDSNAHKRYALTGGGYFYNLRLPKLSGWVQSQFTFRINRFIAGHYLLWGSNMAFLKSHWEQVRHEVCIRNDIHEDLDLAIHLHQNGYRIRYEAKGMGIGAYLKRQTDFSQLLVHMKRWPRTLRIHGYSGWLIGVLGNAFLLAVVRPFGFAAEYFSRMIGKEPNRLD